MSNLVSMADERMRTARQEAVDLYQRALKGHFVQICDSQATVLYVAALMGYALLNEVVRDELVIFAKEIGKAKYQGWVSAHSGDDQTLLWQYTALAIANLKYCVGVVVLAPVRDLTTLLSSCAHHGMVTTGEGGRPPLPLPRDYIGYLRVKQGILLLYGVLSVLMRPRSWVHLANIWSSYAIPERAAYLLSQEIAGFVGMWLWGCACTRLADYRLSL